MRTHFDTHNGTEYDIPKTSSSGLHHVGLQCLAASATLLCTQSVQQVQTSQIGVEASMSQMQLQLDQQSQHITHALDRKMSEQMDKIEALLCKRGRHE